VVSARGLALAATVLMLLVPWEVPGVSFQMSFSAVLALIAGYEALRPWLRRLHGRSWQRRFVSHLTALALTSALAGSASAPYGAYHFGHVQVYFVLSNMVAVPLTALWVMPAGFIGLALMPLHLEALALVPMGWGAEAILWVARTTAALPVAIFSVPHIPLWGLCVFSLGLAWLGLWQTRRRLLGVAVMVVGLASPLLDRPPDLLVSSDARLIALRTPQGAFLQQAKGGSKFTREAWAQYWAVEGFQKLADNPAAGIRCGADACILRPYPDRPGALLALGAPHPAGCDQVSVIVAPEPARGLCPRPWPALVDRFTVWRYGATAIWLNGRGAEILTDRRYRGDRPWVPPPPAPRAAAKPPSLPPAQAE
jgi:competence protein ComEC